jgi:hypothetical protein
MVDGSDPLLDLGCLTLHRLKRRKGELTVPVDLDEDVDDEPDESAMLGTQLGLGKTVPCSGLGPGSGWTGASRGSRKRYAWVHSWNMRNTPYTERRMKARPRDILRRLSSSGPSGVADPGRIVWLTISWVEG